MSVMRLCQECHKPVIADEPYWGRHKLVHKPVQDPTNDVQWYSDHAKALAFSQRNKIQKFIANKCIEYSGGGKYVCHPIEGYNKRTYVMQKNDEDRWECDCQAYNRYKEENPDYMCSHLGALFEFFSRKQVYA